MNLSKAWNTKLEVASFFCCLKSYPRSVTKEEWGALQSLTGKVQVFYREFLCSISTLTCFGSVQGLKGANFIEIQGNICILYRNIALDSYIHVYVLITGISLLFEKKNIEFWKNRENPVNKTGKKCS